MIKTSDVKSEEILQQMIDRFWETIPPVWNHVKKNVAMTAAEHFGITIEQFHILRHVRKGVGSVSELANVKQISRSAISQALDALVEKGLITRTHETEDRRYVKLELTPSGCDLLQAIFEKNRAWMMDQMDELSPEELDMLIQSMTLLKKTFIKTN